MIAGLSDNLRGILAILVSALAFVINDALVKLATTELPSSELPNAPPALAVEEAVAAPAEPAVKASEPLLLSNTGRNRTTAFTQKSRMMALIGD